MKQVANGKMFTFRFYSYHLIQYLLIFYVSSGVIARQKPVNCAAQGEYCLNHWDCCSNSCMSYLYRCARGHGVYPYPFLGISYKPTVSLEDILDQNFGSSNALPHYQYQPNPYFISRFGADDNVAATEVQIVLQKSEETTTEAAISTKHPLNSKETSLMEEIYLDTTTLKNSLNIEDHFDTTSVKNSLGTKSTTFKTSIDLENHLDSTTVKNNQESEQISTTTEHYLIEDKPEAQTDSGLSTTQESVKRSTEKTSCAEIGEKCYKHEDCCDKLCHGYLHKCVT